MREGMSLAAAMSEASPSVTDFEDAHDLDAAERSATVEPTLERLAGLPG